MHSKNTGLQETIIQERKSSLRATYFHHDDIYKGSVGEAIFEVSNLIRIQALDIFYLCDGKQLNLWLARLFVSVKWK